MRERNGMVGCWVGELMCPSWDEAASDMAQRGAKLTPLQEQPTGKHQ